MGVVTRASDRQVGGTHYLGYRIQPGEFSEANELSNFQGKIIQRICCFDQPTGEGLIEIDKAVHELELLVEWWEKYGIPEGGRRLRIPLHEFIELNSLPPSKAWAVQCIVESPVSGFDAARDALESLREA